jgi:hypothetical protein
LIFDDHIIQVKSPSLRNPTIWPKFIITLPFQGNLVSVLEFKTAVVVFLHSKFQASQTGHPLRRIAQRDKKPLKVFFNPHLSSPPSSLRIAYLSKPVILFVNFIDFGLALCRELVMEFPYLIALC